MIKEILSALTHFSLPRYCLACKSIVTKEENLICVGCLATLPETAFHQFPKNPIYKMFQGRLAPGLVTALYFFDKRGRVQELLHQLKYKNQRQLGELLGRIHGRALGASGFSFNYVVPVPLHKGKLKKRRYNQSEYYAMGLALELGSTCSNLLRRTRATRSQTYLTKEERWKNVEDAFELSMNIESGRSVLLVDDVVTTGATLLAAARSLERAGAKVSLSAIAYAYQ